MPCIHRYLPACRAIAFRLLGSQRNKLLRQLEPAHSPTAIYLGLQHVPSMHTYFGHGEGRATLAAPMRPQPMAATQPAAGPERRGKRGPPSISYYFAAKALLIRRPPLPSLPGSFIGPPPSREFAPHPGGATISPADRRPGGGGSSAAANYTGRCSPTKPDAERTAKARRQPPRARASKHKGQASSDERECSPRRQQDRPGSFSPPPLPPGPCLPPPIPATNRPPGDEGAKGEREEAVRLVLSSCSYCAVPGGSAALPPSVSVLRNGRWKEKAVNI